MQHSDLLNLDQKADVVFLSASGAIMYPLLSDAYPDAYYNDGLQGTIKLPHPNNDTYRGGIRD